MNTRITVRFACSYHLVHFAILLGLLVCLSLSTTAQVSTSTNDGGTPPGIAPGAPAGAYPLSGLEQHNHYNGRLSVNVPLLQVSGRGSAGYNIPLNISPRPWIINSYAVPSNPPYSQVYWYHSPSEYWSGLEPGYSPGVMQLRRSGDNPYQEYDENYYWSSTLTRLTFTGPDGTELELIDQLTGGTRQSGTGIPDGYNRGKIFVTRDGSAATFISDEDILDRSDTYASGFWPVWGDLFLRDGTRYRIDGGNVSWMRDRNGNKVTFTYNTYGGITSATDSLNRQITFAYGVNAGYPYGVCDEITYQGFGGATRTVRISKTNLSNALRTGQTLKTYAQLFPELNGAGGTTYNPGDFASALWLPDGRSYQFRYNSYGEIARVELPTGGAIEYDYEAGSATGPASGAVGDYSDILPFNPLPRLGIYRRLKEKRTYVNGSTLENKMVYVRPVVASPGLSAEVNHYDGVGVQLSGEKHYYYGDPVTSILYSIPTYLSPWDDGKEYQTDALAANGTLLRRGTQTWANAALPGGPRITETTSILSDTNQISKQTTSYDQYNNPTDVYEYDYGSGTPGALVRRSHTDYVTSSSYTSSPVHLRSLPSMQQVFDAGSNKRAETLYEYDDYSATTNHAALVNRTNITGLDSSFTTSYTSRGNVTKVSSWRNTDNSYLYVYSQYDIAGNTVKAIDANGNATTLEFNDRFGAPDGNAQNNDTLPWPGSSWLGAQSTFAFSTKVTNALGHITYTQFDYFLSKPVDTEDPNGIKSSLYYNDALDRPTKSIHAISTSLANQTVITYDDANKTISTATDKDTYQDGVLQSKMLYDGFGRTWRKATYEGIIQGQGKWAIVETQFDAFGRVYRSSNPFRENTPTAALPADPQWTTSTFDALGRVTQVTTPDGAHVDTTYSGNTVTVTDQAGKNRKSETDALGRLKKVWENPTGLNYQTDYQYDTLDNLTTVTQGAQTRTFTFDSLKRLTSAVHPESGTTTYTYDNNGNLLTKTDARTAKVTFSYDALSRVISKTYSGTTTEGINAANATPPVYYKYDNQAFPSGAPAGFNRGFAIGRLVAITYGSSTTSTGSYFGYDELGRAVRKTQQINGNNYPLTASYNLAAMMTGEIYPSLRTASYSHNTAGQLATFSGNIGDGTSRTYVSSASYNAAGQKERETYGTGTPLHLKLHYNKRQQLVDLRLGSVDDEWNWNRGALIFYYGTNAVNSWNPFADDTDNNGNVRRAFHYVPNDDAISSYAVPQLADYTYDALNRIASYSESQTANSGSSWSYNVSGQTFSYDRYGNRQITSTAGGVNGYNPSYTASTNQIVGLTYDSAGNLLWDGLKTMTYDAENRMVSATGGSYVYDGEGKRVKRTVTGQEWWYVYGLRGKLVAEYLSTAPTTVLKEYGYRSGQLLVIGESGNVRWIVTDHLGSPRMTAEASGSLSGIKRHDFLPFGEDLYAGIRGNGSSGQYGYEPPQSTMRHRFTGYERDVETGLDFAQARYYSNLQGRFASIDPINIEADRLLSPQKLNLYSYTRNNPLRYVDPSGLDDITYDQSGNEIKRVKRGFWHNLFYGHTYALQTADGQTYKLNQPLRPLPNGETYTLIDQNTTTELMQSTANHFASGGEGGYNSINLYQTANASVDRNQWNWKHRLNRAYGPHALFVYEGGAYASDYIGNIVWGYIMASYEYREGTAKIAAGIAQFISDAMDNKITFAVDAATAPPGLQLAFLYLKHGQGPYYDDSRDTEAIQRGYGWYKRVEALWNRRDPFEELLRGMPPIKDR